LLSRSSRRSSRLVRFGWKRDEREQVHCAPVSRFVLDMRGGKKGLIVNSKNRCHKRKANRARANLRAQSGKRIVRHPVVRAVKCKHNRRGNKGNKKKGKGKGGKGKKR
jgi:hypothetical protein